MDTEEGKAMYRILICDDQPDIVHALKIYLSAEDYQVFEAFDGIQALEILHREKIDLVLLDVMMPKLDGIAATAQIRAFSNIPIILPKDNTRYLLKYFMFLPNEHLGFCFLSLNLLMHICIYKFNKKKTRLPALDY